MLIRKNGETDFFGFQSRACDRLRVCFLHARTTVANVTAIIMIMSLNTRGPWVGQVGGRGVQTSGRYNLHFSRKRLKQGVEAERVKLGKTALL